MKNSRIVTMVLAGGQGSRLGALTRQLAKPAMPFGAKYRIIDFTLSNCYNSGLATIGVLTQYQPHVLNAHIESSGPWTTSAGGGLHILPPFVGEDGGKWYKGTADAIYQNRQFIDHFQPELVVVLSGDHVYKMDYSRLIRHHYEMQGTATVGVIDVPWDDAGRFGIMNTDQTGRIVEFEEKPANPKSNLASMGIYVFQWPLLRQYLEEDSRNPRSDHDFGRNIIPGMLLDGQPMYAYRFKGYWKDVGTVESFWQANMDLLDTPPAVELDDPMWPVYCADPGWPPHQVAPTAKIDRSLIGGACLVAGEVSRSIIFPGAQVEQGAVIRESVVLENACIRTGATVESAVVGEGALVEAGARVGGSAGIAVVTGVWREAADLPFSLAKTSMSSGAAGLAARGEEARPAALRPRVV